MRKIKGTVISDKMQNTLTVVVDFTARHPKYGKIIKKTTRFHVHNELEGVKVGDVVGLSQTKPYSKTVHYKAVEIVSKSPRTQMQELEKPKIIKPKAKKAIKTVAKGAKKQPR